MSRLGTKRAQWLSMLAKLTSPMESSAAAQAFAAYAPMLASFPDEAFTITSLEHVAANCRHGVPTYADLREHLAGWWKENRPPPAIPAIGEDTGLDENARLWVNYFRKREAENFRTEDGRTVSRAHCLSLVKARSTAAWQHLTGDRPEPRRAPTDEEKRAVRQAVAALEHELAAPRTPASHSLTAQIAAATEAARQAQTGSPGTLPPDVLAAARKAAGINGPKVPS